FSHDSRADPFPTRRSSDLEWRMPLRQALDWLRDTAAPRFEEKGREIFKDPWQARNEYINVILNRCPDNTDKFFNEQATHRLSQRSEEHTSELQSHLNLVCR